MMHRIFIAVNLPEKVKKKLLDYKTKWDIPARWTKKENLHITLLFIGNATNQDIVQICRKTEEIAGNFSSFEVKLKNISYGPAKKPPKMIWAEGEKSKELESLNGRLEKTFLSYPYENKKTGKGYTPHITLARLNSWEMRKMDQEEIPDLNEDINLSFEVNSIEVMESEPKRGGSIYTILESCPLK